MPEEGVRPGDPDEPAQRLFDTQAAHWVRQAPHCLTDFTARPAVLVLCEPVAGLRVLDLGCGEGYGARPLRRRGAREGLGLDLSAGMIRAAEAQEQQAPLGIDDLQGDAVDLSRWARQTFDLVLSLFMFYYLDLARLTTCLGEVVRVLRPGGGWCLWCRIRCCRACGRRRPLLFCGGPAGLFQRPGPLLPWAAVAV